MTVSCSLHISSPENFPFSCNCHGIATAWKPAKDYFYMRNSNSHRRGQKHGGKIRYAVVGLGHIAQFSVLPAFENAHENSVLTALISDDSVKLKALGREYGVKYLFHYDEYETCLHSGLIDAVYIALPNNLHREYAVRAAKAGIHVLCEKPLAVTEDDCEKMIKACAENNVKLMTAYRLHFERGNLEAIDIVHSG
ncbi:MAG TPA: Gfo/Idh/MocA family oxidoreductase, partial [Candidatus Baltobacteraceae bacterium]|nr:Gfo/Idh/MocA family oxidoreductase [Candidatus Baltobacteraceae bacterium]